MLRIHQLSLSLDEGPRLDSALLRTLCAKRLRLPQEQLKSATLVKRSVDARDKGNVHFALTADIALTGGEKIEKAIAAREKPNEVVWLEPDKATPPSVLIQSTPWTEDENRPLVVGAGPAGLFCAYALALRGARPILIERGWPVERRCLDVEAFQAQGLLDPESNVLFGEGGAGAFSDGKLTCGLNHPHIPMVLRILADCGAPEEILTSAHPHIGTDKLRQVLVNLRAKLLAMGAEIRFGCRLDGLRLRDGRVAEAIISHVNAGNGLNNPGHARATDRISVSRVFLAVGHSARDTYAWLHTLGVPMAPKPFAVGLRIEHLQNAINRAQYGKAAEHPALPPAEYKLNVPTPDQRGVYTFCMCPGGQVIGAASEPARMNVNGMSYHARDGANANAALLVGIRPSDFGDDHPLAGVEFQRRIEESAYAFSGFAAPCQRVEDFLRNRPTTALGDVIPSYCPGVSLGEVAPLFPAFVTDNLRYALPRLGRRLLGYDHPDALLTAPETRSSAPVRIVRNPHRESPVTGLYPIGEGAGYAGGIISAAVDGLLAGLEEGKEKP